jgi:hypothetical protein
MAATVHRYAVLQNAATGTGTGTPLFLDRVYRTYTLNKRVTGGFAALVVNYEGTIDGINWFQIGTDNAVTAAPTFIADRPCLGIRANVATFTGGTNVSVDVLCGE